MNVRKLFALTSICTLMATGIAYAAVPTIAHRGVVAGGEVENTRASIRAAVNAGYAGVEFDVRLTSDNRAVLLHDITVDATTACTGTVKSMTYVQVTACGVDSFAGLMSDLAKSPWTGEVYVHVKVKLNDAAARGLVKGLNGLQSASQRVVVLVEDRAVADPLIAAKSPGRYGLMVHTDADWSVVAKSKTLSVAVPYQSTPNFPGYDAYITPTRIKLLKTAGDTLVCMPNAPQPREMLEALGGCDRWLLNV